MTTVEVYLVLVRTMYPTNIGAAARVMGNMGIRRLILVNPQCEINSKARQGAAGAQDFLEIRSIYSSWDEFYATEGNGVRIGLTRRDGKLRQALQLTEVLERMPMDSSEQTLLPIYLILGPEDDGLSADDLALVNYCACLPTFGTYASINLSHAAMLASFITQDWLARQASVQTASATEPSTAPLSNRLFFPDVTIRDWLEAMGFDIEKRKASAYTTLKKLLLQNFPSESELYVLEAILQQNIRKLRERS